VETAADAILIITKEPAIMRPALLIGVLCIYFIAGWFVGRFAPSWVAILLLVVVPSIGLLLLAIFYMPNV
jgi:hypothetical protein